MAKLTKMRRRKSNLNFVDGGMTTEHGTADKGTDCVPDIPFTGGITR